MQVGKHGLTIHQTNLKLLARGFFLGKTKILAGKITSDCKQKSLRCSMSHQIFEENFEFVKSFSFSTLLFQIQFPSTPLIFTSQECFSLCHPAFNTVSIII